MQEPTEYEKIIAELLKVCKEVLDNPAISQDDDFFAMGGNSVSAVHILERIYELYQVQLQIYDIVGQPTLQEWADMITEQQNETQ